MYAHEAPHQKLLKCCSQQVSHEQHAHDKRNDVIRGTATIRISFVLLDLGLTFFIGSSGLGNPSASLQPSSP